MIYFLNIMLTWKIVRASEASVIYIYIDNSSELFNLLKASIKKKNLA